MNTQAFTPEEVEKGVMDKFLKHLLELSNELEDSHLDIHITTDGFCTIIEWLDVFDSYDDSAKFVLLNSDEVIMKEVDFPDNHYEYMFAEEVEERLKEWHKEHPEWKKDDWGRWYNSIEQIHMCLEFNSDKIAEQPINETIHIEKGEEISKPILKLANDNDVLRRTDCIVISEDCIFDRLIPDTEYNIKYLGDITTDIPATKWEEGFTTRIPVWYSKFLGSREIIFMTDSGHVLCKVRIE